MFVARISRNSFFLAGKWNCCSGAFRRKGNRVDGRLMGISGEFFFSFVTEGILVKLKV